jgi:hypothetical protein
MKNGWKVTYLIVYDWGYFTWAVMYHEPWARKMKIPSI